MLEYIDVLVESVKNEFKRGCENNIMHITPKENVNIFILREKMGDKYKVFEHCGIITINFIG